MGWSLSQWEALPADERDLWLAWHERRIGKLNDLLVTLTERKMNTPDVVTLIRLASDLV